jgi:hypothetical protein
MPVTRCSAPGPVRLLTTRCMPALLLLSVCLAPAPAPAAPATTSETCLRRCLSTCAEQGRGRDETCLRPCLKGCPVHCGTVDTDCALDCARGAPEASGKDAGAGTPEQVPDPLQYDRVDTAARCAESCTVKPNCRPAAYDQGPAELPSASPAPHARPGDRQSPPLREKRFEPKGRYFSLDAPQGWKAEEQDRLAQGGEYELTLLAKGDGFLDYTQIRVRLVASAHRTAERFRQDLEHPAHMAANATFPAMTRTSLAGAEAWRAERRGVRTLIGFDERVPTLTRTVLLPQPSGYVVLTLEAPEAAAEKNGQVFERLVLSFRSQLKAGVRGPELSALEREVWAAFFRSDGRLPPAARTGPGEDAGAPAPPDPNLGQPQQYLAHTAQTRLAAGQTLPAPALDAGALAELARGCGGQAAGPDNGQALQALLRAWDAVRSQRVLVADNILAPGPGERGLDVQEEPADLGGKPAPARQERMRPPDGRSSRLAHYGGVASLSRVAFSPDGGLALAYAALGQTSPGTSHFVLLRRTADGPEGRWVLCGAAQRDMIIF